MMKTIGFPISKKEHEQRRALLPVDVQQLTHPEQLYFETGYGENMGIADAVYLEAGANIISREQVLSCDVICDPKVGDAEYLDALHEGQTIFGWIHAVQNRDITDKLLTAKLTAYAWEDMFEDGRHIFWRNNELAGEAAVMHAFQCIGMMPYNANVAVIGRGNTARGAIKVLNMLGASVMQYDRRMETLLRKEIGQYDAIINCVMWDVARKDHIIYREDLRRMKPGAIIIDVSCDRCGGIETSVPTTIAEPVYQVEGITHYVVDHTPSIFFKTFSIENSKLIWPFIADLSMETPNAILENAKIMERGRILDQRIIDYQKR